MLSRVNFDHPANSSVLDYLRRTHGKYKAHLPVSTSPHFVSDPYHTLGTHPELVTRLWDEITIKLPHNCSWVVYSTPTLVHPITGIVFGFAFGTRTYGLRLPESEREAMYTAGALTHFVYSDGSTFDVHEVGLEWVLGGWLSGEEDWCLDAYKFAAAPH